MENAKKAGITSVKGQLESLKVQFCLGAILSGLVPDLHVAGGNASRFGVVERGAHGGVHGARRLEAARNDKADAARLEARRGREAHCRGDLRIKGTRRMGCHHELINLESIHWFAMNSWQLRIR